jgi:Prenyltransferase and squalene oxidase repeat
VRRGFAVPGKGLKTVAAAAAALLIVLSPAIAAAEGDDADDREDAIRSALRWLEHHQLADGGYDGFVPGSGTPDALLSFAETAQTETEWGNRAAVERVESQVSEDDKTPLDAAQALARRHDDPEIAARLVTMVAQPLGLDAGEEGPFGDLVGRVADGLADDDIALRDRVELAIAQLSLGSELPEGTLDTVLGAQQADGGWNAEGDAEAEAVDVETTGAVVDLLVLAGIDPADPRIATAMSFVAGHQAEDGTWPDVDGEPSAIATAAAVRAIRAVGHDPSGTCWQTELGVGASSTTAEAALLGLQADDGSFAGAEPVIATSAAVHALNGRWLPRGRAAEACRPDGGGLPFEPSLLVVGAIAVIGVGGGVRILRSAPGGY